MELRRGVISDVENILDLLMDLFSQEEEFEFDREMSKKSIIEILSDTLVGEILVAKQDAKVIGMITFASHCINRSRPACTAFRRYDCR